MKLSIEEAVAPAEGTSEAVAVARAEATRARGEALIAGSSRWPRLDAFGSYERTLISELAGLLSGADLPEELTALPLGREHTYRAGSPSRTTSMPAAAPARRRTWPTRGRGSRRSA